MKENNPIKFKIRFKELIIDYLVILLFLTLLLIISLIIYFTTYGDIPEFSSLETQLIATVTSVIPIVFIFSVLEYKKPYGTYGKRKAGLVVIYKSYSFLRSIVRNCIKFLPWQLAHIGVIDGIYTNFSSMISMLFISLGLILALVMLIMCLFRIDKRHLGDIIANTQVVIKESNVNEIYP